MASKLDYLKKYLAKPAEASSARAPKEKTKEKKHRKGEAHTTAAYASSLHIRDLSDVMPAAKGDDDEPRRGFGRRRLPHNEAGPPDELIFVDADAVDEAQKLDVETSGVSWHIQQHRRPTGTRHPVKTEIGKTEDGDLSPPRGRAATPERRSSPPQRAAAVKQEDGSIKAEPESDGDLSPPRADRGQKAPGPPTQRARHDSDSDLSPPRAQAPVAVKIKADSGSDLSPPRAKAPAAAKVKAEKRGRHDSGSDLSPPRPATAAKSGRGAADSDLSPPRAAASSGAGKVAKEAADDQDLSPPRQTKVVRHGNRHDSDSDLSLPRRAADKGKDKGNEGSKADDEEEVRMSSGLRAGLVRGSDLKDEAAQLRADRRAAILSAPAEETGRDATTVYRSKDGHKISREEWAENQQKKRKKRLADYPEQELEWGGGIKQKANAEAEKIELERVAAQPFARYEPDARYMEELKGKQHWNDPMREFEEDDEEQGKQHNSVAAEAEPPKKKPKCPHAPWANRFNIAPGYRWDGKVRGNGYETKWLETKNQRAFDKAEAWKYGMEEM